MTVLDGFRFLFSSFELLVCLKFVFAKFMKKLYYQFSFVCHWMSFAAFQTGLFGAVLIKNRMVQFSEGDDRTALPQSVQFF
jgi:hypothetical protein